MGLFEQSTLDNKTLFYYALIGIGIIFAFSTQNIKLNLIFGSVIAYGVIYFLYKDYRAKQEKENKTTAFQESQLLPKPEVFERYADLVKFLFSIQDFYIYNAQAYEEMTESLRFFFQTYEETQNNKRYAGRNYNLMKTYKKNAVNALHSIIHFLPNDVNYTEKLNKAIIVMQQILDKYMDKVERMYDENIYENGYDWYTNVLNKGAEPYNHFDTKYNNYFTYDIM